MTFETTIVLQAAKARNAQPKIRIALAQVTDTNP